MTSFTTMWLNCVIHRLATFTVKAPQGTQPQTIAEIEAAGADWYPLALARQLDDAILEMRTNELDIGTWLIKTEGSAADVLAAAKVDAAFFKSDVQAYRNGGGYTLVFEKLLDQVARAVRRVPAVIIDHKIPKQDTPNIDVRTNPNGAVLPPPGSVMVSV